MTTCGFYACPVAVHQWFLGGHPLLERSYRDLKSGYCGLCKKKRPDLKKKILLSTLLLNGVHKERTYLIERFYNLLK